MQTYILQAVSPLHVGDGAAVGSINLPLTRERHSGWPVLPGSSLKGALRQRARWGREPGDPVLIEAFGAEPEAELLSAGRIRFGQAQLLALPVRSLLGTFVLLTCPLALGRMARVCAGERRPPALPELPPGTIAAAPELAIGLKEPGVLDGDRRLVILEELTLALRVDHGLKDWADWLRHWTGEDAPLERLAVVHEDLFTHAVRWWTPARTRASIDPRTGTVAQGHLFTVETLPPETLLWGQLDPRGSAPELLPDDGVLWSLGGQRSTGCGRVVWYRRAV